MLTHDQLQALLNRHPEFTWGGSYGRREKEQVRFELGRVAELGDALSDKDREVFSIRARPEHLAWELKSWLLHRIGQAIAYPCGPGSLETDFDVAALTADARSLDDTVKVGPVPAKFL